MLKKANMHSRWSSILAYSTFLPTTRTAAVLTFHLQARALGYDNAATELKKIKHEPLKMADFQWRFASINHIRVERENGFPATGKELKDRKCKKNAFAFAMGPMLDLAERACADFVLPTVGAVAGQVTRANPKEAPRKLHMYTDFV